MFSKTEFFGKTREIPIESLKFFYSHSQYHGMITIEIVTHRLASQIQST